MVEVWETRLDMRLPNVNKSEDDAPFDYSSSSSLWKDAE